MGVPVPGAIILFGASAKAVTLYQQLKRPNLQVVGHFKGRHFSVQFCHLYFLTT